jgi:hypothetical protein
MKRLARESKGSARAGYDPTKYRTYLDATP